MRRKYGEGGRHGINYTMGNPVFSQTYFSIYFVITKVERGWAEEWFKGSKSADLMVVLVCPGVGRRREYGQGR